MKIFTLALLSLLPVGIPFKASAANALPPTQTQALRQELKIAEAKLRYEAKGGSPQQMERTLRAEEAYLASRKTQCSEISKASTQSTPNARLTEQEASKQYFDLAMAQIQSVDFASNTWFNLAIELAQAQVAELSRAYTKSAHDKTSALSASELKEVEERTAQTLGELQISLGEVRKIAYGAKGVERPRIILDLSSGDKTSEEESMKSCPNSKTTSEDKAQSEQRFVELFLDQTVQLAFLIHQGTAATFALNSLEEALRNHQIESPTRVGELFAAITLKQLQMNHFHQMMRAYLRSSFEVKSQIFDFLRDRVSQDDSSVSDQTIWRLDYGTNGPATLEVIPGKEQKAIQAFLAAEAMATLSSASQPSSPK